MLSLHLHMEKESLISDGISLDAKMAAHMEGDAIPLV